MFKTVLSAAVHSYINIQMHQCQTEGWPAAPNRQGTRIISIPLKTEYFDKTETLLDKIRLPETKN